MDDPWGSPWATNDSNPTLELEPPPRASTTLELPGRTLTRVRSSSNISPWATIDENGDGLGDWGASDPALILPPPTAAASSGAWSGWGGDNGPNSSQTNLSVRVREGSLGLPSPSAWHGAPSPNFSSFNHGKTLSRRSSDKSLFRQPSPDPWAAEFSQSRLSLPAAVHISAEQAAFSTPRRREEVEENDQRESHRKEGKGEHGEENKARQHGPENEQRKEYDREPEDQAASRSDSRHSSISNESNCQERLDSPITSMDEDAKDRPSKPRRPSAKVQELVGMYDGLVKRKDSTLLVPDPALRRKRSTSRSMSIRSARTDDASDFGDFEDVEEFVLSRDPSLSGSPRPTSARGAHLRSISRTSLRKTAAAAPPITSPVLEEASNRFHDLRAKFGPVKYSPDLELVDKLFDVEMLDQEQPAVKDYSLDAIDGIIKDNFTTVTERRTWYRISRPGTMRKHDMGDDDNYRRVTWADSKVKEDATKIVRRWIEHDSYTGRPAIGGGPMMKSGGFNWDSKADAREPLSFDQIFGKRKSVQAPKAAAAQIHRPLSLQPQSTSSSHTRNSSVGVKSLPPRSPLSIPAPPTGPAFGWSTGANGSLTPASSRPSGQYVRQSLDINSVTSGTSRPSSIHEPESRNSSQLAMPPSAPRQVEPPKKSKDPVQAVKDDNDDEWGEMVASPAEEKRPSSVVFDSSMNGSMASLSITSVALSSTTPDTRATLDAVSSKLQDGQTTAKKDDPNPSGADASAPVDVWDFSAFESKDSALSIPPTTTSKPEFDFETPLQSPTLTIPSRTGSPASFQLSKPPTPKIPPPRTVSPASVHNSNTPTPPGPFRPHHGSSSSLSVVRPSPLHNVITPKPSSSKTASPAGLPPRVASPVMASPLNSPLKAVTFAEEEETPEDVATARRIVDSLPNLSYMLR